MQATSTAGFVLARSRVDDNGNPYFERIDDTAWKTFALAQHWADYIGARDAEIIPASTPRIL